MRLLGSFFLPLIAIFVFAQCANARSIRLDQTIDIFPIAEFGANPLADDGSSPELPIESYDYDGVFATNPSPFSINVFGKLYSSYFFNENGSISFGGSFDGRPGNSDPAHAGVPIFAPFFADVNSEAPGFGGVYARGFIGSSNVIVLSWLIAKYNGQILGDDRTVSMQIDIEDISDQTGTPGDFRLEFREGREFTGEMSWETGDLDGGVNGLGGMSARVGFWDGCGTGYEVPGSGVNGALLGFFEFCAAAGETTILACNDYVFEFRGGLPFFPDGTPVPLVTSQLDTDSDGVIDADDNCTTVANPDQRDTNADGYGNACDADLNNDDTVNASDLGIFKSVFFTAASDSDFNGDGVVNAQDLGIMKSLFFEPPGPSCVSVSQ